MNLLFVCSRNLWRSPTAEKLYRDTPGITARSAGTEPSARIRLNEKAIEWADVIFVMDKRHKQRILEKFPLAAEYKRIIILDIEDDYQFMDTELVEEITSKVDHILNNL